MCFTKYICQNTRAFNRFMFDVYASKAVLCKNKCGGEIFHRILIKC